MSAVYWNHLSGVVDDNPLTLADTTLNSTGLVYMPAITAPDFMWLVLDPNGTAGAPEIVKVTAHTASATSCTIVRGQQTSTSSGGGAARQHLQNTVWANAQTVSDFTDIIGLSTALDTRMGTAETDIAALQQAGASAGSATVNNASYQVYAGPSVTLVTGTLVKVTLTTSGASGAGSMSYQISGATTASGADSRAVHPQSSISNWSASFLHTVNAGSNTFEGVYKTAGPGVVIKWPTIFVERLN